ncbi:hypothetical protein BDV93DRAFT_604176 [Ceratobasidium sp. AG-I]|nr:hypothetical protein BDV93DRAFT_604176 [Ceratobasidium sp. AG-I]
MADFFTTTSIVNKAVSTTNVTVDIDTKVTASAADTNKAPSSSGPSTGGNNFSMCEIIM